MLAHTGDHPVVATQLSISGKVHLHGIEGAKQHDEPRYVASNTML